MQRIQAGIIGLGGIGRQFLAEMQNHDHFTLSSCLVEEKIQDGEVGRISGVDTFIHLSRWPRDFQETNT